MDFEKDQIIYIAKWKFGANLIKAKVVKNSQQTLVETGNVAWGYSCPDCYGTCLFRSRCTDGLMDSSQRKRPAER